MPIILQSLILLLSSPPKHAMHVFSGLSQHYFCVTMHVCLHIQVNCEELTLWSNCDSAACVINIRQNHMKIQTNAHSNIVVNHYSGVFTPSFKYDFSNGCPFVKYATIFTLKSCKTFSIATDINCYRDKILRILDNKIVDRGNFSISRNTSEQCYGGFTVRAFCTRPGKESTEDKSSCIILYS